MFRVLSCLATEHDWRLVLVAGFVCFLASLTAISLFNRARATAGRSRAIWIVAAGAAAGCGIWATHFVAMLAYEPGISIAYNIGLTALSLGAAAAVTALGLAVAVQRSNRWAAPIGGGIVGAGVACMHYIGMWAVELPGYVTWSFDLVVTSVALGMLLVDQRVKDFAQVSGEDLGQCRIPTVPASIYDRFDWTKHWALSAAISVGAGVQLSEAAGEWKELADSLSRQSQFAVGDPSGFSMADLAADRAGFQAASAAVQPDSAERLAAELARATPEQLLPNELVQREDGLTNKDFVQRYGGVDDPRFKARVREIDGVLAKSGLR